MEKEGKGKKMLKAGSQAETWLHVSVDSRLEQSLSF